MHHDYRRTGRAKNPVHAHALALRASARQRATEMAAMRDTGATYAAIGRAFGMTQTRVKFLLKKYELENHET